MKNILIGGIGIVSSLLGTALLMLTLVESGKPLWVLIFPVIGGACAMLNSLLVLFAGMHIFNEEG